MYEMEGPQLGALRSAADCSACVRSRHLHCQGLAPAAKCGCPLCAALGLLREWDRLAVNEFLRLPGHRAQELSPNNSMIFSSPRLQVTDTLH
jgi:hypothetical protein